MGLAVTDQDAFSFDDFPLEEPLQYPEWFKESFLELPDDLHEALAAGKKGIIVYFGQRRCAYCRMLMDVNFGLPDIVEYTQRHFDLIPIDIWGVAELTDVHGNIVVPEDRIRAVVEAGGTAGDFKRARVAVMETTVGRQIPWESSSLTGG